VAVTKKNTPLLALTSAAALLTNISSYAQASVTDEIEVSLKKHDYIEKGRMEVNTSMFRIYNPIGNNTSIEATAFNEVISGASPEFVSNTSGNNIQVISSASIIEERDTGTLSLNHEFQDSYFTLSPNMSFSNENDYKSKTFSLSAEKESNMRNRSYLFSLSKTNDKISTNEGLTFDQRRSSNSISLGITQVINPVSIYQTSITYSEGNGYYNDPYKHSTSNNENLIIINADRRPENHSQFSWLNRFKWHYIEQGLTTGLDYRFYNDNWDITSHTVKGNITYRYTANWSFDTSLRYYTQNAASFYFYELPDTVLTTSISTDHRLAAYGSITPSIKAIYEANDSIYASFTYQLYKQEDTYFSGSKSGNSLNSLEAKIISFDINIKF
jgi:hypothetical protein